jgi:predicted Zn-dependent peptidase
MLSLHACYRRIWISSLLTVFFWFSFNGYPVWATDLSQALEASWKQTTQQISEFTLANGIRFIVMERHRAPVISFVTHASVGGVDEKPGQTGIAHFLEHMAFKGTSRIGTQNFLAEQPILEKLDQAFEHLQEAKKSSDPKAVDLAKMEFERLRSEASQYVKRNEFGSIVEKAGGVGLNAVTTKDYTRYFYNFPSNKLELWMSLESERFLDPVFREFYEEQEVILEERRYRVDNSPIGQLLEAFQAEAFRQHPYGYSLIGSPSDILQIRRQDLQDFFETYYGPANLTIGILGDVDPREVKRLAQIYFGRYTPRPDPPEVSLTEPVQTDPREVTLTLNSQPWYLEAYQTKNSQGSSNHELVYDLLVSLLTSGRTSRLYQALVEPQIALTVQGITDFPGKRYSNVILFYALTAPGHSVEEVADLFQQEWKKLQSTPVDPEELDRVKTQAQASFIQLLDSNQSMIQLLVDYLVRTGDWRNLFTDLQALGQITPAEIQRVAQATFQPSQRIAGRILTQE